MIWGFRPYVKINYTLLAEWGKLAYSLFLFAFLFPKAITIKKSGISMNLYFFRCLNDYIYLNNRLIQW